MTQFPLVTLKPIQQSHIGHPGHPNNSHMSNEPFQNYITFSIYWLFVQFSTVLARPPHPPKVGKCTIFFLPRPFCSLITTFHLWDMSFFSNYKNLFFMTIIWSICYFLISRAFSNPIIRFPLKGQMFLSGYTQRHTFKTKYESRVTI